jgi:asparagine synthase (glutamine-hydrolysing)
VAPRLRIFADLLSGACGAGEFEAVWAAGARAPVRTIVDEGGAAVVFGEPIRPGSRERLTPEKLRAEWDAGAQPASWRTWDGYYAAIVFDGGRGLLAGTDVLGIFPFYHWSDGEVVLLASSPEPFRHHPSFRPSFDAAGLVGVMLTNGLVGGRTLWAGARRLAPAHFLHFSRDRLPVEIEDSRLAEALAAPPRRNLSEGEQLDAMNEGFEHAARRHAPDADPCGMFLSGGIDSRLVAGYLRRQGTPLVALTLGIPGDIEMRCARRVAGELGLEHRTVSVPMESYPDFAEKLTSRWEHLASGADVLFNWGTRALLRSLPARLASGIMMDWVTGGLYDLQDKRGPFTFDHAFACYGNRKGSPPALLARLLRPEVFDGVVRSVLGELRSEYKALSDDPLVAFWRFFLRHNGRFNAGIAAWHLCFGAWPVVLALDREIITTIVTLPLAILNDRRAERALVCREFPALARLPLDRNGFLTTPLSAGPLRRFLAKFPSYARTRWLAPRLGYPFERRYFYRIYDLNNEGWRAVRRRAEPWREALKTLFVPEVLDEILPPPEHHVRYRGDLISEGSRLKQLLILALWLKDHP